MAEILWKVFEVLVSLFESCIVIRFICVFLQHDFKSSKGKIIFIVGVLFDFICVSVINEITTYEGIAGLIYILIYLIFCILFLQGNIMKKIFASSIATLVLLIVGVCSSSIISTLFNREVSVIYENQAIERICAIIIVQVLLVCVYDLILKYRFANLKKNEWRLILSILGISFVSMVCIHVFRIDVDVDGIYSVFITIAEFGIIFINVVSFYMTYSLSKSNAETEKLRMIRQQEEYRISYAENIKEQYEEIRRMRHDMKQNLAVISALHRENKYDEAKEFAGRVTNNLEKIELVIDVHNDFINAILNSKLLIASEYGIRVICAVSSNINGIDDIDLCNLLGNILDNAIEAAKRCSNGYIEVSIRSDENMILVIVANTIIESVMKGNKELNSTKKNAARHGYGVKTIRSIAEKYSGTANFYEEGEMFYCQVMMYK